MPLAFGTPLPYDAQIEYLESTGTQYISTGFTNTTNTEFVIDFQLTDSTGDRKIIGQGHKFGLGHISNKWRIVDSSWYQTATTDDTQRHVATTDNGKYYIDSTQIANRLSYKTNGTYPMLLFAVSLQNDTTPDGNCAKMKLFSCKIYDNGIIVRDFIPVRIGQVGYLYDKVGKLFYSNVGTGDFSLGRDIDGIHEVEYIESNGNQWLALPIYANRATDAFEITYQQTTNTNQGRFFWTQSAVGSNYIAHFYIQGTGKYGLWTTGWNNAFNATVSTFKDTVKIDYKNKKFYVNGCAGNSTGNNTAAGTTHLNVFKAFGSNGGIKAKLFGFKFWRNNELQMDCIPVRKDGRGYLFDKIGKKLYGNMGTGSWTLGADTGDISKYTRVDYIQNNSNAFIDTGFIPNQDTKFWFDMQLNSNVTIASSKWPVLFGSRTNPTTNTIEFAFPQSDDEDSIKYLRCKMGGSAAAYNITDIPFTTDRITGEFSKDSLIINQKSYEVQSVSSFTCPNNLYIFNLSQSTSGMHPSTSSGTIFKGYLYGFKIWDGETLVRDFVPVRNQLNVYGLWDLVESKFYPSSSATAFSGGNLS